MSCALYLKWVYSSILYSRFTPLRILYYIPDFEELFRCEDSAVGTLFSTISDAPNDGEIYNAPSGQWQPNDGHIAECFVCWRDPNSESAESVHEDDVQAWWNPVTVIDSSNPVNPSTENFVKQSEKPSQTSPGNTFTGPLNLVDSTTETAAERPDNLLLSRPGMRNLSMNIVPLHKKFVAVNIRHLHSCW